MILWTACGACVVIAAAFAAYPIWFWHPTNNEDWGVMIADWLAALFFIALAIILAAVKLIFF